MIGNFVSVEVTLSDAFARDEDFASYIFREDVELLIEDIDLRIGSGSTDGDERANVRSGIELIDHATDGGLSGAVLVEDSNLIEERARDLRGKRGFERFAADDEKLDGGRRVIKMFDEREVGRSKFDDVDTIVREDRGKEVVFGGREKDDGGIARDERSEEGGESEVESERRVESEVEVEAIDVGGVGPGDIVDKVAMRDHDAFRRACRAGGIDEISERARREREVRVGG